MQNRVFKDQGLALKKSPLINVLPLDTAMEFNSAKEGTSKVSQAGRSISSTYSPVSKKAVMSMEELIEIAQPLRGPNFDPDVHIEEWSDDSSDEEVDLPKTDDEILAELLASQAQEDEEAVPLRRTIAAIYMPIRVNCLYG